MKGFVIRRGSPYAPRSVRSPFKVKPSFNVDEGIWLTSLVVVGGLIGLAVTPQGGVLSFIAGTIAASLAITLVALSLLALDYLSRKVTKPRDPTSPRRHRSGSRLRT